MANGGLLLFMHRISRIIPTCDSIVSGVPCKFAARSWVSRSVRLGMWTGFVLLTLVSWLGAAQLSDSFILITMGFSVCLAGLFILRYADQNAHSISSSSSETTTTIPDPNSSNLFNITLESSSADQLNHQGGLDTNLPRFINQPVSVDIVSSVTKLRIVLLLLGSTFLYSTWILHRPSETEYSSQSLIVLLAFALFALGQMTVGCPRFIVSSRILFLPCFLFGLTGHWASRHRLFAPLSALTLILLCSTWWQSHLYHSSRPPLPTFDRPVFRLSYSKWRSITETVLTLLLVPVHMVFLADQSGCTVEQLLALVLALTLRLRALLLSHLVYPTQFGPLVPTTDAPCLPGMDRTRIVHRFDGVKHSKYPIKLITAM
ncbi:unnamed protein product [Echinostoma caproni]|uniref:Uncharacterized protein n=1 Tax=Echinostoma caproni TaxID=27848 RepID=A0A3P8GGZ5_9TREM|nr:unnamed protein product [Echinostoma caproni]